MNPFLAIVVLSIAALSACAQSSQQTEQTRASHPVKPAAAEADNVVMQRVPRTGATDHKESLAMNSHANGHAVAAETIPASELVHRLMAFADGFNSAQDTVPERYESLFKLRLAPDEEMPTWLKGDGMVSEGWRYLLRIEPRQDEPGSGYTGEINFPVDHWPNRMHEARTCTISMDRLVNMFRDRGYRIAEVKGSAKFRGGWSASRNLPDGKTMLGIMIHENPVYDQAGVRIQTCVRQITINHGPVES